METQLNQIYQQETKNKKSLYQLKNKYLAIVYKGAKTDKPTRQIAKELYDATINKKVVSQEMLKVVSRSIQKVKNKTVGTDAGLIPFLLALDKKLKVSANETNRKITENSKNKLIDDTIKEARASGKVFFLCSSHKDCAKDHLPYQGKYYYDGKAVISPEAREFIKQRNMRTVQWVMGKPVWLITRPHCRHYFQPLTEEEVLRTSKKKNIKKYKLEKKKGDYNFQTPAEANLENYEELLKTLQALHNERPTMELEQRIRKVKMLIEKWKKYVESQKKDV